MNTGMRTLVEGTALLGFVAAGIVAGLALSPKPVYAQTCSMKACNTATNRCESVDLDYKCSNLPKWGCTFSQPC